MPVIFDPHREVLFGAISSYTESGAPSTSEVQYARVELEVGHPVSTLRTYIHSGGAAGRNVNLGLYDQEDASDPNGVPRTRLVQTGAVTTDGAAGFMDSPITPYFATVNGFHWLAFCTDSELIQVACTQLLPVGFAPVRSESGSGANLPATASSTTNPAAAVVYMAAVEG